MSRLIATEQRPAPHLSLPDIRDGDVITNGAPLGFPRDYGEPIVTRKELWSYYRT